MPRSAKDIQLTELKDTVSKLNKLIMTQTESMDSLQKTIEGLRQELNNKQAEIDYLKAKLFGSSSEKGKMPFPGQLSLFEEGMEDDRIPETIEPEVIEVSAHKRERKNKATYEEMFDSLPKRQEFLNTLTEEEKNCPACGTPMAAIGTEIICTELVFHPAVLERVEWSTLPQPMNVLPVRTVLSPSSLRMREVHRWFLIVMFLPVLLPMSCTVSLLMHCLSTGRRKILRTSSESK